MKKITYTLLAFGTVATLLTACIKENPDSPGWEYFPDMYRGVGPETNLAFSNGVTPDSIANRLPAVGSIPRGWTPFPYDATAAGDSLAKLFWKNPMPHNDEIEGQGKFLYERYCIYCHGATGDGNGPLVESQKYGSVPPSYLTRYKENNLSDGHVYHVITYGKGMMGSHASQLTPDERWKVVQYVQRLGRGGASWSEQQKKDAAAPAADSTATAAAPAGAANATPSNK
jgi:mono/diheme cytochrome c family protein